MKQKQYIKAFIRPILPCLLLATAACMAKTSTGGYVNELNLQEEVVIGQTTRDEVRERMGSPSSQSSFGSETWYYISDQMEAVAFFKPEVVDQDVVSIEFDDAGVVKNIKQLSLKDAKDFDLVKRSTPTEGHSMGIVEQLLGNVGRFNRDPNAGPRRPGGL